jgi:Ca2+-binding EF-hand superfamily protein
MVRSLTIAGVLLIGTSSVTAQEEKKPLPPAVLMELIKSTPEEFIKRLDKNGDGVLSKDELPPFFADRLEKADRDGDGKLDRTEVAMMLEVMRTRFVQNPPPAAEVDRFVNNVLQQFDTDKDGKIARAEAKGRLADNFDVNDLNKDGYLDRAELRTLAQRVLPFLNGGPGGLPPEAKAAGPDFDALDKNADGRLSREELAGTPYAARFAEIDADNSGLIDRREFERFLKNETKK